MDTAIHAPLTCVPHADTPPAALTDRARWQCLGGADTAAEIAQQPALWETLAHGIEHARERLHAFLGPRLDDPAQRILFTGAGSSGFIAELAADALATRWPAEMRALHTTSLLTHPARYLKDERPTVLVSFGRSGSSPESVAAIELLRTALSDVRFVNITCNAEGELARRGADQADTHTLLMPAASCDNGFAMTSSLSCMLLAALGVFDPATHAERLHALATLARQALAQWTAPVAALAQQPFERVIYLGSGPLEALAREAALKLLELTAGRVSVLANTPLGFRHGPKSALNQQTLLVMLRSIDPLARRYEHDVLDELHRDGIAGQVLSIGADMSGLDGFTLPVPTGLDDSWLAPVWLLFAQIYALHRSAALGITPDNPFPDGTVNRIVQGVTIYHE